MSAFAGSQRDVHRGSGAGLSGPPDPDGGGHGASQPSYQSDCTGGAFLAGSVGVALSGDWVGTPSRARFTICGRAASERLSIPADRLARAWEAWMGGAAAAYHTLIGGAAATDTFLPHLKNATYS
jgi:hypothetical protein